MTHSAFEARAVLRDSRVVLPDPWSCLLDGLLAAVVLKRRLGRRFGISETVELCGDDLPLATRGDVTTGWWWAASAPRVEETIDEETEWLNGRQDTYTARLFCDGLPASILTAGGRFRQVRRPVPVRLTSCLTWRGVGDPDAVRDLLGDVTHVGGRRGSGFGRVACWEVRPVSETSDSWWMRDDLPGPTRPVLRTAGEQWDTANVVCSLRPPYHQHGELPEVPARW